MGEARKVKVSAGAEWLLGGFGLLGRQPLALGLVGLVFAIISVLPLLFSAVSPVLTMLAQLAVLVLSPILLGGMVYAVREVDLGRGAHPGQLLQGFREGKALALIVQLVPQIVLGLVVAVLLLVMVGPTALQNLVMAMEQAQGQNPDPAMFAGFPFGRLVLWVLLTVVLGVVAYTFTFLFPAQVMFERTGPLEALMRSFRACLANPGAFLVFIVLLVVVGFAIMFGSQIVGLVLRLVVGEMAAMVAAQLLMMTVLIPVMMGAVYFAWRQMLMGGADVAGQPPVTGSGIEV